MASIQQALNQGLAQAMAVGTAAAYGYSQSEGFKKKQEIKTLKSDIENINAAQEKLGEIAADTEDKYGGNFEDTPAYKAADELQPTLYQKRQRLLQLDWEEDTAKKLANDRAALDDINIKLKKEAEQGAATRLDTKTFSARNMLEALAERRDLLSAKERGQLTTMLGRNKTKGGIDK